MEPRSWIWKHVDPWSMVVIVVTLALFIVALFVKGLTSAMLLEAGVFLVSVKLIISAFKSSVHARQVESELAEIRRLLEQRGPDRRAEAE